MSRRTAYWLAVIVLSAPALVCAQGVITTATGATWVFRDDGKPALNAALGFLQGVAVDSAGNVYAADVGNHRVVRISTSGVLTVIAGNGIQWFSGDGGPGTSASVNTPSGLVVDASGNVFVADQESHRIRKVSPDGVITIELEVVAANALDEPSNSTVVISDGDLFLRTHAALWCIGRGR